MTVSDKTIPWIGTPFGNSDPFLDYSFYKDGITAKMTVPDGNGGTRFNRHMMNGIGYLATLGTCLVEYGYPFSEEDIQRAEVFGGYPQGAIVYRIYDGGYVVEYKSKVDNNLNPTPELEDGIPVEDDYWMPLYETTQIVTVPNYNEELASIEQKIKEENIINNGFRVALDVPQSALVVVSRTFDDWPSSKGPQNFYAYSLPNIMVVASYNEGNPVQLDTLPMTNGKTSQVSIPMGKGRISVTGEDYLYSRFGSITISIKAYKMGIATNG